MPCLFPKEQCTCEWLPVTYNKRALSSWTKGSLTQTLEILAPKLKKSCYFFDSRIFFKHSSLAATFCVSAPVSAARKYPKSLYVIRQPFTRGVLSLNTPNILSLRQPLFYYCGTFYAKSNSDN